MKYTNENGKLTFRPNEFGTKTVLIYLAVFVFAGAVLCIGAGFEPNMIPVSGMLILFCLIMVKKWVFSLYKVEIKGRDVITTFPLFSHTITHTYYLQRGYVWDITMPYRRGGYMRLYLRTEGQSILIALGNELELQALKEELTPLLDSLAKE